MHIYILHIIFLINKEYERLDEQTNNKLIIKNEETHIEDFIKHS